MADNRRIQFPVRDVQEVVDEEQPAQEIRAAEPIENDLALPAVQEQPEQHYELEVKELSILIYNTCTSFSCMYVYSYLTRTVSLNFNGKIMDNSMNIRRDISDHCSLVWEICRLKRV